MFCTAGVAPPCEISAGKETALIASALPADGTPPARFHARISARPAIKGGYAKSSRFYRTEECVLTVQPMLQMGQRPPRQATSSATARLVIGAVSVRSRYSQHVRFASKGGPTAASQRNDALCHITDICSAAKKHRYAITLSGIVGGPVSTMFCRQPRWIQRLRRCAFITPLR